MCSINGCTGNNRALVERMNVITAHRGPDASGVWEGTVTLGNDRLAIIDLSPAGAQPMKSADGKTVIAFNGEIYNYRELKQELSEYPYKSESDTEVILAGYAKWGTGVFQKLNGIFAIALWDESKETLFLARDRAGIKPLYVFRSGNDVIFSSEIKALFADASVPKRLDTEMLEVYLRLGFTPGPKTLFKDIEKLPPGSFAEIKNGSWKLASFVGEQAMSPVFGAEAEELLRMTVDAAVKRQLVSDVPLGLFLSGGIDSSVVLDAMSRAGGDIDTYSIGFAVKNPEDDAKFNADFRIAKRTAAMYGTRHHEVMMGTEGLPQLFEDAIYHLDEPVGNATALPQLLLSRFARKSVTVALAGDGGDELFGGYPRYLLSRRMDAYQMLPSPVRSLLAPFGKLSQLNVPQGAERYALFHFIKDGELSKVAPKLVADGAKEKAAQALSSAKGEWMDAFMKLDKEWWLVDEALLRADKMSMAASLEARVPLLDNEVVALAGRISNKEKVSFFGTKLILRNAFKKRLPEHLFSEPKRGWFSPGAKWLREPEFKAFAQEVLSADYAAATRDLFDWSAVQNALTAHIEHRGYNLHLLWTLLALQVWARKFNVSV